MRNNEIPYWEKYMLTLREAAEYFHIGEKKMRQIVDDNLGAPFLLKSGDQTLFALLGLTVSVVDSVKGTKERVAMP